MFCACAPNDCFVVCHYSRQVMISKVSPVGVKTLTIGLAHVGAVRMPGWGPRDPVESIVRGDG